MTKTCKFNPKNKPLQRVGRCQNEEHKEYSDKPNKNLPVQLTMQYGNSSDEFVSIEDGNFIPGTETYYCSDCFEGNCQ